MAFSHFSEKSEFFYFFSLFSEISKKKVKSNQKKVKKFTFFQKNGKSQKKVTQKIGRQWIFQKNHLNCPINYQFFCFINAILRILRRALGAVNCFDIFVLKRLKGIGPNGAPLRARKNYNTVSFNLRKFQFTFDRWKYTLRVTCQYWSVLGLALPKTCRNHYYEMCI